MRILSPIIAVIILLISGCKSTNNISATMTCSNGKSSHKVQFVNSYSIMKFDDKILLSEYAEKLDNNMTVGRYREKDKKDFIVLVINPDGPLVTYRLYSGYGKDSNDYIEGGTCNV